MKKKGVFIGRDSATVGDPYLVPDDARAREIARSIVDKKALVWVHTARYPEHHRLAFAVMQKIADACGVPVEIVLLSLKYETGRFDWVELVDGTRISHPRSIAFESMDQADFQKFWDDSLEVLKDKWLPRLGNELFEEVREMISGKWGNAA